MSSNKSFVEVTGNFPGRFRLTLQFIMNGGSILFLVITVSVTTSLKLNRQQPSTAWGVQKKVFRFDLNQEYFQSRSGRYHFMYDTGNGRNQIFRKERRLADGTVSGFFGYVDPEGVLRITEYTAGRGGYRQRTVLRYPVSFSDE